MASRSIANEIKCKYSKECSSYSVWIGDGKSSKCVNCKNNEYQNPEELKKDYYEANMVTKIINVITIVLIACALIGLCALIFYMKEMI